LRPVEAARIRLAAKHADNIRKAMGQMYDAQKITSDFFETHPAGGQTTPTETRSWARTHIRPDHKPLLNALRFLYADAWVLGEKNALAQYGYAVGFKKADAPNPKDIAQAMAIDWKEWEAGNAAAAALLSPPSGLQSILDSRMTTISSIDQTSYDRLGTKLADALNQGLSKEDTASLISDVITDPARANMIAVTESARATCVASRDMYESFGVEYVEWLVAEGCEDCQQNRDAGPIPIDATFPSGDSEPPAHPNCMCDLAPYVVDTQNTGGGDALDASFTPIDDGGDSGDSGAAANLPTSYDVAVALDKYGDLKPVTNVKDLTDLQLYQAQKGFNKEEGNTVLTKDEIEALRKYKGDGYISINQVLRGNYDAGIKPPDEVREDKALARERTKFIDSAMEKAPALPEDVVTYRGIPRGTVNRLNLREMTPGTIWHDEGFSSTALTESNTLWFSGSSVIDGVETQREGSMVVEVVNPKGTKGIMLDGLMQPLQNLEAGGGEREWLLPRGTRFQVLSNDGKRMRVLVIKK